MSGFTIAWLVWIVAFFGIEGKALLHRHNGDTLSEHIRRWFGTDPAGRRDITAFARVRRIGLLVGLVWLSVHLLTNGFV